MIEPPEIAVVVCTFERPWHLRRCLLSLDAQQGVDGKFEVVVVDDGSADETAGMVERMRREVGFPLRMTTHPHDGFQQARCRNEGILASTAPYVLFTDGDCILPPNHLARHLAARQSGVARAGDCWRIDQTASEAIDEKAIRSSSYLRSMATEVRRWRRRLYLKAQFYQLTGNSLRPKLIGWNMAVWRADLERVNGFDQWFRAWSCEDDDLAQRLRAVGVRVRTALGYTHGYHLWHPVHSTTPTRWRDGVNVPYLTRPVKLARCLDGLQRRSLESLSVRVIAGPAHARLAEQVASRCTAAAGPLEAELLFWPAESGFSKLAEHRILLADELSTVPAAVRRQAGGEISLGRGATAGGVLRALDCVLHGQAADAVSETRVRAAA